MYIIVCETCVLEAGAPNSAKLRAGLQRGSQDLTKGGGLQYFINFYAIKYLPLEFLR